jgi:hypothetical protein
MLPGGPAILLSHILSSDQEFIDPPLLGSFPHPSSHMLAQVKECDMNIFPWQFFSERIPCNGRDFRHRYMMAMQIVLLHYDDTNCVTTRWRCELCRDRVFCFHYGDTDCTIDVSNTSPALSPVLFLAGIFQSHLLFFFFFFNSCLISVFISPFLVPYYSNS